MFLFIIVAACAGLIANRQWELDAVIKRNFDCTQMVVDLKHKIGECGQEQLNELNSCQVELKNLSEVKGKCLVYEENIKEDNSKALVKQADDLMVLLSKRDDLAAKEAERKDECEKHLRKVEVEARQLVDKMAVLLKEKEDCNTRYKKCTQQVENCNKNYPKKKKDYLKKKKDYLKKKKDDLKKFNIDEGWP